jgi:hypothetical protein
MIFTWEDALVLLLILYTQGERLAVKKVVWVRTKGSVAVLE